MTIEGTVARSLPSDPKCPSCARGYAIKIYKPHAQKPTFHCDPTRPFGGCGKVWTP